MVRQERINPTGLDWRRFVVATDSCGDLIGCGQVKPHRDGARELASIVVIPEWRGQAVARAIIEQLLNIHPRPLYLTCRASLIPFYEKFSFNTMDVENMPPYFQRISRLMNTLMPVLRGEGLAVMMLDL
jgi:N-acetylglutamate synthase-like GNAT family acetyltransferase